MYYPLYYVAEKTKLGKNKFKKAYQKSTPKPAVKAP
jgi:hypothetical protein